MFGCKSVICGEERDIVGVVVSKKLFWHAELLVAGSCPKDSLEFR